MSPRLIWMLTGDSRTDLAGRRNVYILNRLLHWRAAHHQSGRRTQEWHFARAWRRGEFLLAWGDRSEFFRVNVTEWTAVSAPTPLTWM